MKQHFRTVLPVFSILATLAVGAQVPPSATPAPPQGASTTVTSRIARFLAGPDDRPQGFLLRNGIFVMLSPDLAQQLPAIVTRNTSIRVSGDELTYAGCKTIAATSLTFNGVTYRNDAAVAPPAPSAPVPSQASGAMPPTPPGQPGPGRRGPGATPPPPCGAPAIPPAPGELGVAGRNLPPPPADSAPIPNGSTPPPAPQP